MTPPTTPPTWLITGSSSGFGLLLCLRALKGGHRVIAALRNPTKSSDAVNQLLEAGAGGGGEDGRIKILELDMTESQASIHAKVRAVGDEWPIDYLVNNAGYSILGASELFTEKEATLQLQTNFLGPLYTLQAVLPSMRARARASSSSRREEEEERVKVKKTIINISSIAARDPGPSSGLYSASKAALEALSESLAREVGGFGIRVLIVEPGAFRTNFLGNFHRGEGGGKGEGEGEGEGMEAYKDTPADKTVEAFAAADGKQGGDPVKGVERIWEAVTGTTVTSDDDDDDGDGVVAAFKKGWEEEKGAAAAAAAEVGRLVLGADAWRRNLKSAGRFMEILKGQEEVAGSTGLLS